MSGERHMVGDEVPGGRVWVGACVGVLVAMATWIGDACRLDLACALGAVCGALAWLVDGWRAAAAIMRIEEQLVVALELLGSSVSAGLGLVEAVGSLVRDVRGPLRRCLVEMVERLRLGDDPQRVFADAERRLPLPGFRLLTQFLAVQWQSGGALAPGLEAIADSVRERMALARRVHAQTAEARFSVFGILLVVYGIAWLSWANDPERVAAFLRSSAGGSLVAACVAAQAFGIVWMARLTQVDA